MSAVNLSSRNGGSIDNYGNESGTDQSFHLSEETLESVIPQVVGGNWDNISFPLSDWQKSQLENAGESGVRCLLNMWLLDQKDGIEGNGILMGF